MRAKLLVLFIVSSCFWNIELISMMRRTSVNINNISHGEIVDRLLSHVYNSRLNLQEMTPDVRQEMIHFLNDIMLIRDNVVQNNIMQEAQRRWFDFHNGQVSETRNSGLITDPEIEDLLRRGEGDAKQAREAILPLHVPTPSDVVAASTSTISKAEFEALNHRLNNGDILSHSDVKKYIEYAESKGIKHDNYKRLKYWITNKAGDYSMNTESGHTSFYTCPKAVTEKMKSRLEAGEGLSYADVTRLLAALQDAHRNYREYRGQEYADHAGSFNGMQYGNEGNAHEDFVANQEINYKNDTELQNKLATWARVPGNLSKKYYADSAHDKQVSTSDSTELEESIACLICAEEKVEKIHKLPCCDVEICNSCVQALNPKACPYCRAKITLANDTILSDRLAEEWFNANKNQIEDLFEVIPNIPSTLEEIVHRNYGIIYREDPIEGFMKVAQKYRRGLPPISPSVDKRVLLDLINTLLQQYHNLSYMES